ncbi:glycosyltransferase family 2 protein [Streptococcus sp. Marseille-Q5112]|uniref:glycosyltransferase family 2 protein n=1 Tax=Streptococcus sp. Marseille-Q5112 TaxID=2866599 RepID=UPI001CE4B34F|nr:glycosyltransferase family 2 protein [Streptococcus sp. Marseille-Q5112]
MFISIVVPVYNIADYLHYAIDSLLKQTYQNFEVILVNDGSTDDSSRLCEDYAREYENIHVFHKENRGLSDARNFGVTKANSDWIFFLDPDDYLEDYTLELIVKIQEIHQADLISTKVKATSKYNAYTSYRLQDSDYKDLIPVTKEKALELMLDDKGATVSACAKLYRKCILERVPFPVGKIYEDFYVVAEHLALAERIVISPLETYNYYRREGSIVRSTFTEKRYDFFEAVAKNEEVIKREYIQSPELKQALQVKKLLGGFVVIGAKADSGLKDFSKDKELLRVEMSDLLKNNKLSWKLKLKYLIFIFSPKLYLLLR